MLKLFVKEENNEFISYKYLVEGKEADYGIIKYIYGNKEYELEKKAPGDQFGSYSNHAFSKLREYVKDNKFIKQDLIAWY